MTTTAQRPAVLRVRRARALTIVAALLLLLPLVLGAFPSGLSTPADAQEGSTVRRLAGADRFDTAAKVAIDGWGSAGTAVLATGRDFPDALAAAPLSARVDAPILLTQPDALPAPTVRALDQLGVGKVFVLGGEKAVGSAVVAQLEASGRTVERLAGEDRFATAAAVARHEANTERVSVAAIAIGSRPGGAAFPDALAAASLSGLEVPVPLLLTRGDAVPAATSAALADLGVSKVLVLGGESAVPATIADQLSSAGYQVERLAGETRFATGIQVAQRAQGGVVGQHGAQAANGAVVATGTDFADALAAGALAARRNQPLLLSRPDRLADVVDAHVRASGFGSATIVGGEAALSAFVGEELAAATTGQPRPEPPLACDPAFSSPDCAYTYRFPVATWERLAGCESNGNWAINTGNGYYGGIQFNVNSWRAVGGQGYPHQNSKWEQIHRGELLQARQGWGAWPACTRKLGIR